MQQKILLLAASTQRDWAIVVGPEKRKKIPIEIFSIGESTSVVWRATGWKEARGLVLQALITKGEVTSVLNRQVLPIFRIEKINGEQKCYLVGYNLKRLDRG